MIKQERLTKCCGQCCLATILGISLEEAIKLVGHNSSTKSKELTKHFKAGKNKRGLPEKNGLCILRFDNSKNWHWILKLDDNIYDSLKGKLVNVEKYFNNNPRYRVTSHFPIL